MSYLCPSTRLCKPQTSAHATAIAFIILCATVLVSSSIAADWRKQASVSIVKAPQVEDQFSALPPNDRKRIERAIAVASKFVALRLTVQDNLTDQMNEDVERWKQDVGPLMAMDYYDWARIWEKEDWSTASSDGLLIACSSSRLTALNFTDTEVTLTYDSVLLGVVPYFSNRLNTKRQGQIYALRIFVGPQNRITKVLPSEQAVAWGHNTFIEFEQRKTRPGANVSPEKLSASLRAERERTHDLVESVKEHARSCAGAEQQYGK